MKLAEFMKCPVGTVYSNYTPCLINGLHVKTENCENIVDFWSSSLLDDVDSFDFEDKLRLYDKALTEDVPLQFCGSATREGSPDPETLYAVWSNDDLERFREFLESLPEVP